MDCWTVRGSTSHDENMNCNGEQHHKQGVLSNGQPTNQQQNKKGEHPMNPRAIANLPVFFLMRGGLLHSNSWRWSSCILRRGLDTDQRLLSLGDVITFGSSSLLIHMLSSFVYVTSSQIQYICAPHCGDSTSHCMYPLNMGSSFSWQV
jgi:hypothetical protein